jgi:Acyltransferase
MRSIIGFLIVMVIRLFSQIFWRLEWKWINPPADPKTVWKRGKVMVLMNHTSLYEPLFCPIMPIGFTWQFISRMAAPAAAETLNRPVVGTFWKMMIPRVTAISRKRDDTWSAFMDEIAHDSMIVIAPEGRMKRPNGLDKHGNPMTVKGGIVDILSRDLKGSMVLFYSGGLHHVQSPGEIFPRPFKKIKMNLEWFDIEEYKNQFSKDPSEFRAQVIADLQLRLELNTPS